MSASVLNRGKVRGDFMRGVEVTMNNLKVKDLAIIGSTASNVATFGFLQPVGEPQRRSGPRGSSRSQGHQVQIINERFDVSESVGYQDWVNDETSMTRGIPGEIGASFANLLFKLICDHTTDGGTGTSYDGAAFFSAAHYGTQRNDITATQVPALTVGVANAPTPEEMVDAIMGVIAYMMGYVDQENRPMNENARNFLVVCPAASLWAPSITAINANNLASGQTSIIAALNDETYNISAIATPRLTDDDVFYVFRTDQTRTKPFIISENIPVDINMLDESSDHFKKEKEFMFIGDWWGGISYGEPLYASRCQLST